MKKPLVLALVLVMSVSLVAVFSSGGCGRVEEPVVEKPAQETIGEDSIKNSKEEPPEQQHELIPGSGEVTVKSTDSSYKSTTEKPVGWLGNHQEADILLSGVDFNNAGGPLLFNHQGGIASDGEHLILADRNNNRVLIWNSLPDGNTEPDIVLGQKDFTSNNPGEDLDQLNWPVSVATDGTHILVADTYNYRVLIWNNFPNQNGQPADLYIQGPKDRFEDGAVGWPWAVWTNGEKVIVTSTAGSQVLIWNSFPTRNNQEPDIVIRLEEFGTPRTIGSDGTNLVIGDHNAFGSSQGNFFWKTFPNRDNQKYDFFMENAPGGDMQMGDMQRGEIMWGPTFTPDGKFMVVSDRVHIWNAFPEDENDAPDLSVGETHGVDGYDFGGSQSGDGSSIASADGKLFISLCNGNKIVGFNNMPTSADQEPEFVIGAPDIYTNTLETEFIMSNPVPATDGNSLFVSSDFDRKLYVWKSLPDESGAKPDYVYSLPEAPWDNALHNNILALAGKQTVYVWNTLPVNGEEPDRTFSRNIGSVSFGELAGVAMDDKYFYLSDGQENKIYVWEGIPDENSEPIFTIQSEKAGRLSSNGEYLATAATLRDSGGPVGSIVIYKISDLAGGQPTAILNGMFNLPQGVLVYDDYLFVGDTGLNAVHIWTDIKDALDGKAADIFLGEKGPTPKIGSGDLFWPATLAFDGSYLWVGEFKFSERLLRFSVQ
ncbi:MAG: hypothetical protein HQ569_06635 [Actinobacteria bacterium]|nr:hypothetical protein [Actinomycetota bacterium]